MASHTHASKTAAMVGVCACLAFSALAQPPQPPQSGDDERCEWHWQSVGGIGVWTERCRFENGVWQLEFRDDLPGFVLAVDGEDQETVLRLFDKRADEPIAAVLPALRTGGFIPDDEECVFEPVSLHPVPRTQQLYQIMPIGHRLAVFEATPPDEIPAPPCGDYGWSTHGVRYFLTDIRRPEVILYVNVGQDGMFFDARTVMLTGD